MDIPVVENISESTSEVRLTVYGDPVPKQRPRFNGHVYTPDRTKDHEVKIGMIYKAKYHGFKFEKDISLRVELDFYLSIPKSATKKRKNAMIGKEIRPKKRPDTDNLAKTVLDAGNGLIWEDDSQIVELLVRKYYGDVSRTEICVAVV